MLELQGDKVILREFTKDNLNDPQYFSWLRDPEVVTTLYRVEYLLTLQFSEVENYVNNLLNSKNDCFFAIYYKKNNKFIGTQRIGHIDWRTGRADLGILIGNKKYWRKGIAKDSIRTASVYAFKKLSLRKLTAGTPKNNIAMCKCFEALDFKQEGILREQLLIDGEYVDHVLYGILRREFFENYKK